LYSLLYLSTHPVDFDHHRDFVKDANAHVAPILVDDNLVILRIVLNVLAEGDEPFETESATVVR
jgi:hypothetical protein